MPRVFNVFVNPNILATEGMVSFERFQSVSFCYKYINANVFNERIILLSKQASFAICQVA